jgi:hypothetical protein
MTREEMVEQDMQFWAGMVDAFFGHPSRPNHAQHPFYKHGREETRFYNVLKSHDPEIVSYAIPSNNAI